MSTKYHTRSSYEQLYGWLIGTQNAWCKNLSDYQLLNAINKELIRNDCIPFDCEELEMELH